MLNFRETKILVKSTALYGSFVYNFEDLNLSYWDITTKLFPNHPSQEFLFVIKNLFLTANKNSCDIGKLVSKDWQLFYLKNVRNTLHSFEENLDGVKNNRFVVNYKYQPSELSNQFLVSTLSKLEDSISEFSKSNQKKAKKSLEILKEAYQSRYIRLEIKLNERALPLLRKLEKELIQELPDYEKIGSLEKESIKLLVSFEKKANETMSTIRKHEKLFQLYQEKE
jgi:hypothetical protein